MKSVSKRSPALAPLDAKHLTGFAQLLRLAARTLRTLNIPASACQPDIFLLTPKEMKALAAHFFRRPERHATVLAFDADNFPHPESLGRPVLGQIDLNRELRNQIELLSHGLLHLLGYRHDRARDMIRMQRREKELRELIID